MRQIFSVILAAALVFGGTLLFAGYFEGVQVPEREPEVITSGPHPINFGYIPGELWHCPDVERILAAPLPKIFSELYPPEFEQIGKGYSWQKVGLWSVKYAAAVWVHGQEVICVYRHEEKTRDFGLPKDIWLSLAPDWEGNIPPPSALDPAWFRTGYRPDESVDGIDAEYECNLGPTECGFYVVPRE